MTVGAPWDAIVVGAGPAGSAAAAVLAEAGRRVLVLEKDRFPREKVCGELLAPGALASLERIGARQAVEDAGPERMTSGTLHVFGRASIEFPLPAAALGLSRRVFDDLLARRARSLGAEIRFSTRVRSVEGGPGHFAVRHSAPEEDGNDGEERTRVVIGAWGRWDALDRALERSFVGGARYFGWSRDFGGDTSHLAGRVALYLFPGGYCGLSRVEGKMANLAGVVSDAVREETGASWDGVVAFARRANPALDRDLSKMEPGPRGFLGTVPVFFTRKPPVENGILMAGDAAGVLDPFSGQGQAAALSAGILSGEMSVRHLEGSSGAGALPGAYAAAWRARYSRRFVWSALLRRFILDPRWGPAAAGIAGERLVRFGIRRLWAPTGGPIS